MGLTAGARPFGHSTDAAVDIEGLVVSFTENLICNGPITVIFTQLLEDHLKRLRQEDGAEEDMEDDEAAWNGWDVESDSDESSDGWISVESDGDDDLEVSDSDDEDDAKVKKDKGKGKAMDVDVDEKNDAEAPALLDPSRVSTLATTKVCSLSMQTFYFLLMLYHL